MALKAPAIFLSMCREEDNDQKVGVVVRHARQYGHHDHCLKCTCCKRCRTQIPFRSFTGSLARRLFPNSPPKPVPAEKQPSRREAYLLKAKQFSNGPGLKYAFMKDGEQRFGFASGSSESQIRAAVLEAHPDARFIPSE